jgi:hypothetical protein
MSLKGSFGATGLAGLAACLVAGNAAAFCGFFVAGSDAKLTNDASQVALMRKGNRTVMTMSNDYKGPPEDFAMVVPVPVVLHKEDVKTLPPSVFDHIDSLSAPRLVEYWEQDPCAPPVFLRQMLIEGGGGSGKKHKGAEAHLYGVTIEAQFVTGEYQVVILSAKESTGLETWLRESHYNIPPGAAAALAPYVRDRSKFFVAKVDVAKVQRNAAGVVQLSPLRFAFDASELRLPVRLGLLNTGGKQDLIVYVLHPTSRFEVANYPNVFVPTNLEVADAVRAGFPAFYAALFDATLERAHRKAVVTEYAWQTTSCDPCPTPPLSSADLATLGLDVLEHGAEAPATPGPGGAGPVTPIRRPFFGGPGWVLTRLHTRYSAETLGEDLVFREAPPVVGGRGVSGADAGADTDAQVTDQGVNNFQSRYIIRHYWTDPVACATPIFGRWGGPTPGAGTAQPTVAKGLATAPRGKVDLAKDVHTPVPLLGIAGQPPPRREGRPAEPKVKAKP